MEDRVGSKEAAYRISMASAANMPVDNSAKVQGLSLSAATLALNSNIFSDGQAFAALSRGKDLSNNRLS
ncbi:hypothetical protein MY8738_001624 [Beauveria namnaoensis]